MARYEQCVRVCVWKSVCISATETSKYHHHYYQHCYRHHHYHHPLLGFSHFHLLLGIMTHCVAQCVKWVQYSIFVCVRMRLRSISLHSIFRSLNFHCIRAYSLSLSFCSTLALVSPSRHTDVNLVFGVPPPNVVVCAVWRSYRTDGTEHGLNTARFDVSEKEFSLLYNLIVYGRHR